MANEAARGSHKLLSELIKKGHTATAEEVKAAVSIPKAANVKLLNWYIRGIPPVYFEVSAVVQAEAAQVSTVLNGLFATAGLKAVNILTNGIPVYDIAEITATFAHTGPVGPVGPGGPVVGQ